MTREEVKRAIAEIEESYEFCLAYAAQGLAGEAAARQDGEVRRLLERADTALGALPAGLRAVVAEGGLDGEAYGAMLEVLERDAAGARAALRLVLAQPVIGSQLVDNLNASIHVRALLTDLFLIDEALDAAFGSRA